MTAGHSDPVELDIEAGVLFFLRMFWDLCPIGADLARRETGKRSVKAAWNSVSETLLWAQPWEHAAQKPSQLS
jgi:hypothetical protein